MLLVAEKSQNRAETSKSDLITEPIQKQMKFLADFLMKQVEEFEPEVRELVKYGIEHSGKQIRPMLVFYSGWQGAETVSEDQVKAAAVIELIHLATLVHDDVLDEAILRRKTHTVNEKYGRNIAVLLGDALFAQALKVASEFPTVEVCRAVSESTRRVCTGEIWQTFQQGNPFIDIEQYFHIIKNKTAELFYVSCYLGAKLGRYNTAFVRAVSDFGYHLGIAYQIYDDLTDFLGEEKSTGKTLGTDVASGKFTLPLLIYLKTLSREHKEEFLREMKSKDLLDIQSLNQRMVECGVFDRVENYFSHEIKLAEKTLEPFSDYRPVPFLFNLSYFIKLQIRKLMGH